MLSGAWAAAAKAVNPPREFPATMASAPTTSFTKAQTLPKKYEEVIHRTTRHDFEKNASNTHDDKQRNSDRRDVIQAPLVASTKRRQKRSPEATHVFFLFLVLLSFFSHGCQKHKALLVLTFKSGEGRSGSAKTMNCERNTQALFSFRNEDESVWRFQSGASNHSGVNYSGTVFSGMTIHVQRACISTEGPHGLRLHGAFSLGR